MEIKLNLIPDYRREEIKKAKSFRFAIKEGFLLTFIFILIFGGLFCFDYILRMNLDLVSNSIQSGSKKESFEKVKKLDAEFGQINESIAFAEKIQKSQLYWSQVLLNFNKLVPDKIIISDVATKDYEVMISGTASDRDSLIEFKSNLEKEKCFSAISLPLSDLVAKNNVDFQMEFNIKKECLKKQ